MLKKPPQKVAYLWQLGFFFSAAPTAQNSPELHFRFINCFIPPSLLVGTVGLISVPHQPARKHKKSQQLTLLIYILWEERNFNLANFSLVFLIRDSGFKWHTRVEPRIIALSIIIVLQNSFFSCFATLKCCFYTLRKS